jgi:predicted RNA-binding Zn-ribbon protein involved in translation (DUF1610 family)
LKGETNVEENEREYTGVEVKSECPNCGHIGEGFREFNIFSDDPSFDSYGLLECPNCGATVE